MSECNLELAKLLREIGNKAKVRCDVAADAIESLDAENAYLKNQHTKVQLDGEELSIPEFYERLQHHGQAEMTYRQAHANALIELEAQKQKFAAIEADLVDLMWHSGEGCQICSHAVKVQRREYIRYECDLGPGIECEPEWRGNKKEVTK